MDFPTLGSRGSRVSQAPAFSPFQQLQATGPWWDPEPPAVASPIGQRGLGDQCGVQKKMRGLARLVFCEVTEDSLEVRRFWFDE